MGGVIYDHARRKQVQLDAAGRVPGVRAAVDFYDDRNRVRGAAQFVGDFRDEPAFALITERDAHIGDKLAGKREQGHGCEELGN